MNNSRTGLMLFSGTGNLKLSEKISKDLRISLGKANVGQFSDGEISVQIEDNVRGMDVFLIQPTCSPANNNLMELLNLILKNKK